ncbi:MAG: hypothetical protein AAB325_13375, partial [Pseudomonadota bacterium]
ISILGPVRHANILRPIMNIHLRDDRIETIVPVMVALNENELAVQPLFKLPVFIYSAFFPSFEYKITQKEDRIVGFNSLVMFSDDRFIHFLCRLKRPLAIANDIEMRKVIV